MTPQPELRLSLYVLLQHTTVLFCNLELLHLRRLVGDELKLPLVVSASWSVAVHVEYCVVQSSEYLLCSREHRSVVIKEVRPVVYVVPERHLVGDISYYHGLSLLFVLGDDAQCLRHRYADATEALAHVFEETVEVGILQHVVYLTAYWIRLQGERQRRYPLPVAVVTEVQSARLSLLDGFVEQLCSFECATTHHLLLAYSHHLQTLHHIVAEPLVEAPFNATYLVLRLLGKRVGEVLTYYLPAIPYNIVCQEVEEVRQHMLADFKKVTLADLLESIAMKEAGQGQRK